MEDRHSAGHKANWMTRARKWVHAHGHIKAVVYFDSVSPKGYDFRLEPTSSVLSAFRALGQESNMRAMP